MAVISSVAVARNTDPAELDPLYDSIDPEALDTLLNPPDRSMFAGIERISFPYHESKVTIYRDGRLIVT